MVDVQAGDALLKTARFEAAALQEAEGLQDRGAFRKVKRYDLPPHANVIKGGFVFTRKDFKTPEEQANARYVAQGQLDKAKAFVVHNSSTLRQRSTRIILSTSINNGFRIFLHDITQVYFQSREGLTREIYLDPRPADRKLFDLDELYNCRIPLNIFTDARQLFDVISRASHTTEKRLMIDVATAREAYNREDLSNVGLVAGKYTIADGLKKLKRNDALERVLDTGVDDTPVDQWVVRAPLDSSPRDTTGPGGV